MKLKFFHLLALSLLAGCGLISAAPAPASETLFGVTFLGNELLAIDRQTGAATSLGSLGATVSPYGIVTYGGKLYTFDPNIDKIRQINPINGAAATIIDVHLPDLQGEGDLAFRPSDGVGFLVSALDTGANPTNDFYTFDITNGTSSRLGTTGVAIDGLAFRSDGTLYALGQGDASLYTINPANGAATKVGDLGIAAGSPIAGIGFAPDPSTGAETLYGAIDDRLYKIDTTTGAATPVSPDVLDFGYSSVSGLVAAVGQGIVGNLSGRVGVGTGDNVAISGFIVQGAPDKKVIIRGLGPSLANVPGVLADPVLEVFNAQNQPIGRNDNWQDSQAAEISASMLAPADSKEAAIILTLPAGVYTAVLTGKNNTTGIGLIETYDLDPGGTSRLANVSDRGLVQPNDETLIGGLIVRGSADQNVLIRAIGPTLASAGVANALQDPNITVYDANGSQLAFNDDWQDTQQAAIQGTSLAPNDPRESAILAMLTPGAYTAVVRGGTGIALLEVYTIN